jgi:hypothetical protein
MLFDLRGRGRRRTVQAIYLGLALIFLLGFVGFGVGVGGSGGGLINALTENNGSNSASFASKVAAAQKHVKREPNNPKVWAALVEAQLHQASEEQYYDSTTGQYTSKGKQLLNQVSSSWNTYLNLESHNPSTQLALKMIPVYGEEGINQPAAVVQALQIVIPSRPPTASLYGELAEYSYKAHNVGQGDLASEKAISLTPANLRARVRKELEEIKKNPNPSGSSKSTVPSGTYTTTVGGKTYVGKPGPGGTLTAAPATTTPAPTSSTKKK